MSKEKFTNLVQQAASAITLTSPDDLSEMPKLQECIDDIQQCLEQIDQLPVELKDRANSTAKAAGDNIQKMLSSNVENSADLLDEISRAIVSLEELNRQIEKGISDTADQEVSVNHEEQDDEAAGEDKVETKPDASKQDQEAESLPIDTDDIELVKDFVTEAGEHVENAEAGLLELENSTEDSEAINMIFRAFHTIKGMAGFLNLTHIGRLAHAAENLLDLGRKGEKKLEGLAMDVIFESVDMLKKMMEDLKSALAMGSPINMPRGMDALLDKLKSCTEGECGQAVAGNTEKQDAGTVEKVQPEDEKKEPETESEKKQAEVLPAKEAGKDNVQPVEQEQKTEQKVKTNVKVDTSQLARQDVKKQTATDEKIKVSTSRLDNLVNMVGELVIAQSMVSQEAFANLSPDHDLCRTVSHQGKIVRELQELSMMMRMVPIQGVFQKMARLVRDLSQKSGKKVKFSTEGEETELDRIVVDQIGDPLVHMIRNSVDHGIEPEEERTAAGKDPVGSVHLKAYHQAGSIVIEITDDGRGLNKDKILQKAMDNGILQPDQELADSDIYKLIFHAGLSTAAKVTDVSGRGVGMDVVKKNIESLRGKIDIESTQGQGSKFIIRLPLTMAIIEGQIVRIGKAQYIIPIVAIESCLRPTKEQISTVQGRAEMVMVQGQLVPMVRLYNVFEVEPDSTVPWESSLVVVEEDGQRGSLMVDELLGQNQVVIKSLGEGIGQIPGVSGGAIMGDGRISLIVDVPGLLSMTS